MLDDFRTVDFEFFSIKASTFTTFESVSFQLTLMEHDGHSVDWWLVNLE